MKTQARSLTPFVLGMVLAVLSSPVSGDGLEAAIPTVEPTRDTQPSASTACQETSAGVFEPSPLEVAAFGFCRADCEDGSTISTNCSGTCTATDQNCPGTRGQVTCNGTVVARCPACDNSCTVTNVCPDGTFLQCSSSSGDCIGGQGLCFVRCDGVFQWCPGHEFEIAC